MNKRGMTPGRVAIMAVFALSCFGLLLFLWLAFGGPIPLKPQGYRLSASFAEATQLAKEADVRVSGVPVGKVKTITPDKKTGRSDVLMQIESRYAPVRSDARAILRQKTLLGETYVELTPGTKAARAIPEGGTLATSRISPTVELDEIFRSFNPKTRRAFQVWMQSQARAIDGHGRDINDALGNLGPFAEDASVAVDILNRQQGAVKRLISNTGVVFGALTERDGQLRSLIENSDRVFKTTAARDRELQDTFVALPTFERESRQTLDRLTTFAKATDPLVTQLRPAARELSPTLSDLSALAPDLKALFRDLDPLITASKTGFPAAQRILKDLRPLLAQIDPTGRQLVPILQFLGLYKTELNAFFGNTAATTQALDPGTRLHYLRTTNPFNPENLAAYPRRIGSNRTNPYQLPGNFSKLASGLESYETRHCNRALPTIGSGSGAAQLPAAVPTAVPSLPVPGVVPTPTAVPTPPPLVPNPLSGVTDTVDQLINQINRFAFPVTSGTPAPPCKKQGKYDFSGEKTQYPHVKAK